MGKKDKKKGKGAEKTAAKTEKKFSQKLKKELAVIGEDDIEKIVADIEEEERRQQAVTEKVVQPPSRRVNFSLTPHPDKDELIFFGGEFYNGQKTRVFNDMYFYNIQRNEWTQVKSPNGPAPRCSHQAVSISADRGQIWLFGGEFISPSQTQFYHYKDLWVYYIAEKKWEKINASGGPSSRSGHRMVCVKKQLIVFGGFHESHQDFKYFNDVYAFSLENRTWKKLEPSGTPPSPRSGFQMFPLSDGKILIFGGYSKVKVKKDVDKGVTHTDMFLLSPEKGDTTGLKWKWCAVKPGGIRPSPRSGVSAAIAPANKIFTFGGVLDQDDNDDDEDLVSEFYNDLYILEADRTIWRSVSLSGKKEGGKQKRRRKKDAGEDQMDEDIAEEENEITKAEINEAPVVVADDGIFTMTVGPSTASEEPSDSLDPCSQNNKSKVFIPCPRINSGMAIKHGVIYLFGGIYEEGDKQYTLADFYSLDIHKLDEWQIIIPPDNKHEWLESSSESDSEDSDDDDDGDEDVEPMEVN
ncbi:kelch domain-containing protein 4 [Lycorma delicatula]|uniref:kelch domain-containing protein 4 n=1 Tax=Lycorma delicatula TaxID=130591 RepID=UPI003F513B11